MIIYVLVGAGVPGGIGAAVIACVAEQTRNAAFGTIASEVTGIYDRLLYGKVIENEMSSITPSLPSEMDTGAVNAPANTKKQTAQPGAKSSENRLIRLFFDMGKAVDRFFGYPAPDR